ncbi:MAG: STAS domain-containing protein [Acidimicrobiales bacterium]
MDLGLMIERRPPMLVLSIGGDLEMSSVPQFRDAVIDAISAGEHHLVVDLSATDFIDSTGLGALIGALKRLRSADGSLQVACAQPRLQELFKLTDLDKVFVLHQSVEEVVAAGIPNSSKRSEWL